MNAFTLERARAAKLKAVAMLRRVQPQVGVGITRIKDGYGLKLNLERQPSSPLPQEVDGVPVRVEIVGSISKRSTPD